MSSPSRIREIQYAALTDLHTHQPVNVRNLGVLKNNIFPDVTQRAIAIFEDVDPQATLLHLYVGGLVEVSAHLREEIKYFRVTYSAHPNRMGMEWFKHFGVESNKAFLEVPGKHSRTASV